METKASAASVAVRPNSRSVKWTCIGMSMGRSSKSEITGLAVAEASSRAQRITPCSGGPTTRWCTACVTARVPGCESVPHAAPVPHRRILDELRTTADGRGAPNSVNAACRPPTTRAVNRRRDRVRRGAARRAAPRRRARAGLGRRDRRRRLTEARPGPRRGRDRDEAETVTWAETVTSPRLSA